MRAELMNTRIHAAVLAVLLAPLSYSASLEAKSSTKPATLDMGPGCRVGLRVPLNADFDSARPESGIPGQGGLSIKNPLALKRDTYTKPFALRFVCYDANTEDANRGLINNGWAKQLPDGSWAANVMPGDEDLYARAYQLRTKTASGWAVAVEDVIGHVDERLRARWLHYCLIRQPKGERPAVPS